MTYLLTAFTFGFIDSVLRPLTKERNESKKYAFLIFLLFILAPFFLVATVLENSLFIVPFLQWWDIQLISYIGFVIYLIGGIMSLVSRAQLGKYASGTLVIQEEHELFTGGLYKYIRNPLYTGGLIGIIGFLLVFRTIITLVLVTLLYFVVLRGRILEEEKLLQDAFGDKFSEYCKNTYRLLPGVY
jgi:protein-S-isoprenylcysteine O-methyltransferase Ste14